LSNDNGDVLWEESYKPYGERLDNTPNANKDQNNQWFTGKQEEADLGLQYFGARWYHQASGRFISRDPAGVLAHVESNPMMFNRYAYANNNPYKYVDPDGRYAVAAVLVLSFMAYDLFSAVGQENAPGDDSIRPLFEGAEFGLFGKLVKRADTASDVAKGILPKHTKHSLNQKINRKVKTSDELDAIRNPLDKRPVKYDSQGRPSQRNVGEKAEVVINPETNKIVSVNPTSSKKSARLKRRNERNQ
jgi:RHS repeat-associated protein